MSDSTTLSTGFLNRPAAYTQPEIFQRMLTDLASTLPDLKTREEDDPTIALLDVCAVTLDVLSFYQQQFNTECYLNTATELFSVRELARSINYELNPGVAAQVYLAFQIDANANNTGVAFIPAGTQIQSTPQQGKLPQSFETSLDLTAYAAWNQITPYQPQVTLYQNIHQSTVNVWLSGISTGLVAGDVLLLIGKVNQTSTQAAYSLIVQTLVVDIPNNRTQVTWQENWATDPSSGASKDLSGNHVVLNSTDTLTNPQLWVFNQQTGSFGNNAPLVSSFPTSSYYMQPGRNDWDAKSQIPSGTGIIPTVWKNSQAAYFGANNTFVPKIYLSQSISDIAPGGFVLLSVENSSANASYPYQKLYVLQTSEEVSCADFGLSGQVTFITLNDMQGNSASNDANFLFRSTAIYLQNKPLDLYTEVIDDESFVLSSDNQNGIPLANTLSPSLQTGQKVVISHLPETLSETITWDGNSPETIPLNDSNNKFIFTLTSPPKFTYQPDTTTISSDAIKTPVNVTLDLSDSTQPKFFVISPVNPIPASSGDTPLTLTGDLLQQSEMFTIGDISFIDTTEQANTSGTSAIPGRITIYPENPLVNRYYPRTTLIYGNVVAATHGATVSQVLGSGDATQSNQTLNLQKLPLTYLPSSLTNTAIPGIASTLTVMVNEVIWDETPSLYGLTPNSKNYVLTQEDNGQVNITFGDGLQGARLPTGQENITATYRQGIGTIGNVPGNSLILLQTRPQGVLSVTNPAAAAGGVDPESLDSAYQNAPSGVLTLNRLVSQTDFENYASTQTSVGKSRADFLSQAHGQPVLFMTLSAPNGAAMSQDDIQTLLCSISQISNLGQNIIADTYESLEFNVAAKLTVDSHYQSSLVLDQVRQTLLNRYGFNQQKLAQPVIAGDLIETIRKVPGVLAVDLDAFYYSTQPIDRKDILDAEPARLGSDNASISPAQLLTINPNINTGISLTAISPVVSTCP